ncbi:beta-ketoacyl synthase N-terminal-like domain-containing protein [Kitasatospora sp. NPDC048540]|uniref:beta-ketoacyl synthase N-terminal-like domain-containing protein n=1 Tax=Kitasatospora sp. NPDC048540 TaxID=3155634 RepID=UPI0033CA44F4
MAEPTNESTPIAIVGMAGRFPGAADVPQFWAHLLEGAEQVREFGAEELRAAGVPDGQAGAPTHLPYGADLADADLFDAEFFGLTPRDAMLTDPQHRLFLTCAWEALQDAGHPPSRLTGRTGVFGSTTLSTYLLENVLRSPEFADAALSYPVLIGNDKDFLTTRVSYRLGLTGPSMAVQSACSGSLAAVHLACGSLRRGESDLALAGGVSVTLPQTGGYGYQEGGIMSRDGHCRVFDARSSGTVKGNGCAVVALRRLDDALADGDQVYAVIRGTAVTNDGSDKIGFTAPGPAGQQGAILAALADSGIPADRIGYVETHGTGTSLGDPIELRALAAAHTEAGGPAPGCAIGSVKANLGHLDAAAGVVGLVKAALVLRHQTIPPQINFERPNPLLRLDRLPYRVVTEATRCEEPLTAAAVSSFGLGGTNAHVVLSAPPARDPGPEGRYPVVLSARDPEALRATAHGLLALLRERPVPVAELARTLLTGRDPLPHRYAFAASTAAEVTAGLRALLDGAPPGPDRAGPADLSEPADPPGGADRAVRAWLDGADLDPADWGLDRAGKVSLPPYPLRPTRHWIDPAPDTPDPASTRGQASTPGTPAPATAAARPAVTTVAELFERHLRTTPVGPDDDYYDLGGDSLTAVDIVTALRDAFGADLDLDTFAALRTPRRIAERLNTGRASGEQPDGTPGGLPAPAGLTPVRDGDGRTLFLLPPAGGTNFCYFQLAAAGGRAGVPLAALTFPADRPATLRALAAAYLTAVRAAQPHGPYRLGGYSFGGNVAFELALQLQEQGEQVELLVMFDSHPPEAYVGPTITEKEFAAAFPLMLRQAFAHDLDPAALDHPPADLEELLELARMPHWTDATAVEYRSFFRTWKHNHDALKGHYPDRRLRADLVLLHARDQENRDLLEALQIRTEPGSRWQDHLDGELRVVTVPGDHFTMFADPGHLKQLAAALDSVLADHDRP